MTVIVGLVDKTDGSVYMGGDSAATTTAGDLSILENRKVFLPVKCPWFIVGFGGSFRLGQLLRYSLAAPRPTGPASDLQRYMTTEFVNALRKCFKSAGFARQSDYGRELGGSCLVGYQGHLFRIEDDYQILLDQRPYVTLGAGESLALGAMFATEGFSPEARIRTAMQAAVAFNATCREPFHVIRLPFQSEPQSKTRKRK